MSGLLRAQVWASGLTRDLKPLAAAICDIVDHEGNGLFASVQYLTWLTGYSERTVQTQLSELRRMGLLLATCHPECFNKPGTGHGRGQSVTYRFVDDKLPVRESWAEFKARQKGASSAPLETDERVQNPTPKGAEPDAKGRGLLHPIRSGDPEEEPTDQSDQEPLTIQQEGLARHLRRRVMDDIFGARTGTLAVEWGEDVIRDGATREDIDGAIAVTLGRASGTIYGSRGASYVLGCIRNAIEDRKGGRDAHARTGGGRTGADGSARQAHTRGIRTGDRRSDAPGAVDPRYDYERPVPVARRDEAPDGLPADG